MIMKAVEFRRLIEEVANCHICEKLVTLPHLKNSERLENDDHGLDTDHPYLNRWNLWHGNLDADIMVIGQDYGTKEDGNAFDVCNFATTTNPTNARLKELFMDALRIDLDANETPLFFTNMANCYRKKRTSGGMHSGWLPICANKYMERLIRIIRPKIIIVLGRSAFEAMHCMEQLSITCSNSVENGKDSYAEIISHNYQIDLDGSKIDVFPVYHPGANSQLNRTEEEQLKDWQKIKDCYDKVK